MVICVILTPFPFYKNIIFFQADIVLIKVVLYLPNFSLMFLIHVFLYAGVYCTKNGRKFFLNGWDKIIIPNYSHILTITALYFKLKSQYLPVSLKIKHSNQLTQSITYTSTETTQSQTISINLVLAFGHLGVELASGVSNEEILLLIKYRVP